MNERARWQHRRTLYGIIVCLIVAGIAMQCYAKLAAWAYRYYAVTSYVVVAQNLDDEVAQAISSWFDDQKTSGRLQNPNYEKLNAELVSTFPLIGLSSWSRYSPTCLTCKVIGVEPVFCANKYYVAGDNGRLYRSGTFRSLSPRLPHVRVNPLWLEVDRFPEIYKFFAARPKNFLSTFDCFYHDPYKVVIEPKESLDLPHRCVCVVDDRSVSLLPDMVALMSMCRVLHEDNKQSPDEVTCYFDFRFSGRIISKCITHRECVQLQRV